jgi:hypothetical protein
MAYDIASALLEIFASQLREKERAYKFISMAYDIASALLEIFATQ